MDAMNPNGSSQGFVNLLTSQQEQTLCFSQSVDLGSSQVPIFATQLFSHPSHAADERKERRKWSPVEDVVLISAWLNTSKDPIISNEQKAGAFWKRITESFNNSKKMENEQDREAGQLKHRWQRINDHVCKFVACYETALKQQSSGQNENDVMKAAHHIFYNDHMFKFTLEKLPYRLERAIYTWFWKTDNCLRGGSITRSLDMARIFWTSKYPKRY
ncbi:glutathione S-transferase T3-like [Eutrema salsugineum]|uniref:glutathione S-transferase T3-like n=1 Tax=Eutrema salsugineum TaxID=72664 RepID=UPI000CED08C4|nr:glutathione S-transferase T3-like [Eutrema salsugineum]